MRKNLAMARATSKLVLWERATPTAYKVSKIRASNSWSMQQLAQ